MIAKRGIPLRLLASTLLGSAMVLLGVLVSYATLDFSLGFVFAAPIVSMLVAIVLAGEPRSLHELLWTMLVLSLCASIPVLLADLSDRHFILPCLQLGVMCIATTSLAAAGVYVLRAIRLPSAFAVTIVLMIALAWIAFPVWVSHLPRGGSGETVIDSLLTHHPLLAINGAFLPLGDWSHMPIAYRYLTNLGQDVPLALPRTAWLSAGLHGAVAAVLLGIGALMTRSRKAQENAPT